MNKKDDSCNHPVFKNHTVKPWTDYPGLFTVDCEQCGSSVTVVKDGGKLRIPSESELKELMKT